MNTPLTYGDYIFLRFSEDHPFIALAMVAGFVFMFALGVALQQRECRTCGRTMHRRWRKPDRHASRLFCPFHDDGAPW